MFDKTQDIRHIKKLLQIKLRDNQYLPNVMNINSKPHKKLSKSRSQLLNLSSQIESNRKHISSVNRALHKKRPVDYYDEGKYIYDREIEKVQKLLMDNLKNKNDKLEIKYKNLKKKMIKLPLYKLNGLKKKKKISKMSLKPIHLEEENNIENNNEENKEEQNEQQENNEENQEEEEENNEEEDNKNNYYNEKQEQEERRYSKYSKNNEKYEKYTKNNDKRNNYKKNYRNNYDDEDDDEY